jgi:hypothetical protein
VNSTAEEVLLREAQHREGLKRYCVGLTEMMAESQRRLNRVWRRVAFQASRRAFRQRFIKRWRR